MKFTLLHFPSVTIPSSRICNKRLYTSKFHFSISSKRTIEYGLRRTFSVSIPHSSYPTYQAVVPMSFEALDLSWNSLISILIRAFGSAKNSSANTFTSSVFPTHVGPRKRKEPIGRFGFEIPTRDRLSELTIASIDSSCPIIRFLRMVSSHLSRPRSSFSRFLRGTPVI